MSCGWGCEALCRAPPQPPPRRIVVLTSNSRPSTVSVKHGKNKYPDVDLDPEASTEEFKALMFSLTSVEPERQKIMVKGGEYPRALRLPALDLPPERLRTINSDREGRAQLVQVQAQGEDDAHDDGHALRQRGQGAGGTRIHKEIRRCS